MDKHSKWTRSIKVSKKEVTVFIYGNDCSDVHCLFLYEFGEYYSTLMNMDKFHLYRNIYACLSSY